MVKVYIVRNLFLGFLVLFLLSCEEKPEETKSVDFAVVKPGDIVVSTYTSDALLLFDKDGNFKDLLYNPRNNIDAVFGIDWNPSTKEIVVSINGSPDRVMAINAIDGSYRKAISNTGLNGSTYAVAIDVSGNYLVGETHTIEKFSSSGSRIVNDQYPAVNTLRSIAQISSLKNGGYIACGTTDDRANIYDTEGNLVYTTGASGISGTTNAYGCVELANGNIAVAWEGSQDSVVIYDSTLSQVIATFRDPGTLSSPRSLAVRENGNILISDAGFHWIVEIDSDANFVQTMASGYFSYPWGIKVIPDYTH